MTESRRRGPYAKGVERRRQILREALALYAGSDSSGPSLRAIAERVGLSERGLLHYFPSRDELLVAILAERDAGNRALFDEHGPLTQLAAVTERTAGTPGLVRLFVEMAAAAPDPGHAAHDFFRERYRRLRATIATMFGRAGAGAEPAAPGPAVDPEFAARVLIAASDGLQQQWLLDRDVDLVGDLRRLSELLVASTSAEPADR